MALFENLKNKVQDILHSATDTVTQKAETVLAPKMNICMLGARGVGKTSIITSMYYGQQKSIEGTDLFLIADSGTDTVLMNKRRMLENIFAVMHDVDDLVQEVGLAGDSTESHFDFTYGMNSEHVNISLQIRDYPGEYLRQYPDLVANYVKEADAILIAIDTVCLMENNGRYNDGKNKPQLVMDFLVNHLPDGEEKLVLFVPLKCEKYAQEERLGEVTDRIKEVYAELIHFLRDKENLHGLKQKICCAITPIETLGGVVFDSFAKDFDGSIIETELDDGSIIPSTINYRYANNDEYTPRNCAQPLYYLLGFFAKQYTLSKEQQSTSGFLGRMRELFRLVPNIDAFSLEASKLGVKRERDAQRDVILFGRGRVS